MNQIRHGGWIQTFTGLQFWPMDARPSDVEIVDIAHSLSLLCRFNGHCRRFYSVAEHSVLASKLVAPEWALWGLLHDASEAYLADLPQPIKHYLASYREAEEKLLNVIADRFGLSWGVPEAVKEVDRLLLATEKAALMGPEPASWGNFPKPLEVSLILRMGAKRGERGVFAPL